MFVVFLSFKYHLSNSCETGLWWVLASNKQIRREAEKNHFQELVRRHRLLELYLPQTIFIFLPFHCADVPVEALLGQNARRPDSVLTDQRRKCIDRSIG